MAWRSHFPIRKYDFNKPAKHTTYYKFEEGISFAEHRKLVAESSEFNLTLKRAHRVHFFQLEIRQKKRYILSEKRESGMALKKHEFTPESGTVDTYVWRNIDVSLRPGICDTRHQSFSASTQPSQNRHARPKRTDFLCEKQNHIHQSSLNPPDRATTISLNPPDRATTILRLITQSIGRSRERCWKKMNVVDDVRI